MIEITARAIIRMETLSAPSDPSDPRVQQCLV